MIYLNASEYLSNAKPVRLEDAELGLSWSFDAEDFLLANRFLGYSAERSGLFYPWPVVFGLISVAKQTVLKRPLIVRESGIWVNVRSLSSGNHIVLSCLQQVKPHYSQFPTASTGFIQGFDAKSFLLS